jgi:hypothetical protein
LIVETAVGVALEGVHRGMQIDEVRKKNTLKLKSEEKETLLDFF